MASEEIKLPVIDFFGEDLMPGTPTWDSAKTEVRTALQEFGCFIALYDKIPMEIRNSFFESSEELFDLPLETKVKNSPNYVSQPAFETIWVDELTLPEKVESFTDLMWPQGNSRFSKTIQFYSEHLSELNKIVRRMVLESLNLEKYMDEHMDSTDMLLQFSRYKGPQSHEKTVAIPAHTDNNILGIMDQNETNGLEILAKDGQWIEINLPPHSLVVQAGEVFHELTNGRVHAPSHREMAGDDTRYSIGIFTNSKPGYTLKAPEEGTRDMEIKTEPVTARGAYNY